MSSRRMALVALCIVGLVLVAEGHAQEPPSNYATEYIRRLKLAQTISPYGEAPFGEQIDLYTGQVTFNQTDIVLEGTGPTLRIGRSRSATGYDPNALEPDIAHYFADWTIDLPRIETLVAAQRYSIGTPARNWRMTYNATDPESYKRCTRWGEPYVGQSGIPLEDWWHGYEAVLWDGSRQTLLIRDPGFTVKPSMAGVFPVVTLSNLQMSCLPEAKNVEAGQTPGEAFLAIAPDGTKYWLDWLVGSRGGPVTQRAENGALLLQERLQVAMFVTRIEDRFGNSLTYTYDNTRLLSIQASDGRRADLTWTNGLVTAITTMSGTAAARTWTYGYSDNKLVSVTLPDQSQWTFNLQRTGEGAPGADNLGDCGQRTHANTPYSGGELSTITAPSGLTGTFLMQIRGHGRSYTGSYCTNGYELVPPLFKSLSLYERTLAGPGVPLATWRYLYAPAAASTVNDTCAATNSCPDTTWIDVIDPDGSRTRYTSSTRYNALEGKQVKVEVFSPSNALLRAEEMTYVLPTSGLPYQARIGDSMLGYRTNVAKSEHRAPLQQRITTQQGRTFTWRVESTCGTGATRCFDTYARPTRIARTSAPVSGLMAAEGDGGSIDPVANDPGDAPLDEISGEEAETSAGAAGMPESSADQDEGATP